VPRKAARLPVRWLLIGLQLAIGLGYPVGLLLNVHLSALEVGQAVGYPIWRQLL
jgi:hypothetical protein